MSDQFKDFFALKSDAGANAKALYGAIENTHNAIGCYELMFKQCIEVLKKRSMEFRNKENIGTSATPPTIDANLETAIVAQLDETLIIEDENLTLFEATQVEISRLSNWVTFKFKIDSTSINTIYQTVQVYFKRQGVNDLIQKYQTDPSSYSLPSLVTVNDNSTINTAIDRLMAWIQAQIPPVKKIIDIQSTTDWKEGLTFLFDPNSDLKTSFKRDNHRLAAIDCFCQFWESKPRNFSGFNLAQRQEFIDYLKGGMIAETDAPAPWSILKSLAEKYKTLREYAKEDSSKKIDIQGKSRLRDEAVMIALRNLWTTGLALETYAGETQKTAQDRRNNVAAKIKGVLEGFTAASNSYYDKVIRLKILPISKNSIEQEYNIKELGRLKKQGNKTASNYLFEDCVESLKGSVDRLLASIPLNYSGNFKPVSGSGVTGCEARIFTFDSYGEIENIASKSGSDYYINVTGDPKENGEFKARPIFYYDRSQLPIEQLVISNLSENQQSNGVFFFEDRTDTRSIVIEVARDKTFGITDYKKDETLTIDFGMATINGKTDDGSGTNFTRRTSQGGITRAYFFEVLNAITKWQGSLKGMYNYSPYYHTVDGQKDNPVGHVRRSTLQGRGRGMGRADVVREEDVLWCWETSSANQTKYEELPELLGLPMAREIKFTTSSPSIATIDGQQYDCVPIYDSSGQSSFQYGLLECKLRSSTSIDREYYVLTNTPYRLNLRALQTADKDPSRKAKRKVSDDVNRILELFNFQYFRKVDSTEWKVLKSVPAASTRRPNRDDGIVLAAPGKIGDPTVIGINLPTSFRISDNVRELTLSKAKRQDIKNKASVLYTAKGEREDAGSVMGRGIYTYIKSGIQSKLEKVASSKLSATAFTATVLANAKTTLEDWQKLKHTNWKTLTVDQEWCHLQGHGDGGTERVGNFVSGSYHCNTEQLAMEEGLRATTHKAKEGSYLLRTTAYLLKDDGTVMTANYLASDATYAKLLEENKKIVNIQLKGRKRPSDATDAGGGATKKPRPDPSTSTSTATTSGATTSDPMDVDPDPILPIAAFIRYKIIRKKEDGTYEKVWDHTFEGQSEFFDRHQYMILNKATEFALAGWDEFEKWYTEAAAALAAAKASSP